MKKPRYLYLLSLLFTCLFSMHLRAQSIATLQEGEPTSIRGLSVVDDQIAWVSGSKGYIGISIDGGKNWSWGQVKGFEKADFRDIEAFSAKEAVIMSSGTPALVLKTNDGGKNWKVNYRNTDSAYFFDAMDFKDRKHGYIVGDPINNKFLLMETKNGGMTWLPFKYPPTAISGEAAFAASGTCLRIDASSIVIATGGTAARSLTLKNNSTIWEAIPLPVKHGRSSQGTFSTDKDHLVFVGGDYSKDKETDSVAIYRNKGSWTTSIKGPSGFQSCVENITDKVLLSTGTSGSNITTDAGKTWVKIDDASYNVCRKAKHGTLVLLAGNHGKIGILHL